MGTEAKKHYLVTGGGFSGNNLVQMLLTQSDVQITCIDDFDPF